MGIKHMHQHKTLRLRVRGRKVVGRRAKTTFISKSIIQIKLGRAGSRSAVVVVSITICHTKRRYWNHLSYSSVQCTPPEGTYFVSLDIYLPIDQIGKHWNEESDNNFFFLWRDRFLSPRKMLKMWFFPNKILSFCM